MNRDIVSVLLGGFGTKATGSGEAMAIEGEATMTSSADVAAALTEAGTVSTHVSRCCSGRSVPCLCCTVQRFAWSTAGVRNTASTVLYAGLGSVSRSFVVLTSRVDNLCGSGIKARTGRRLSVLGILLACCTVPIDATERYTKIQRRVSSTTQFEVFSHTRWVCPCAFCY